MNRLFIYLFLALLTGCWTRDTTVATKEELLAWVSLKKNGYTGSKVVGEVKYTCKVLPSLYLAWRDMELEDGLDPDRLDEVRARYDSSLVFLFNISPEDPEADWDVMTANVEDYEGYREKVKKMSFDMNDNFSLLIDGESRRPAIVRLENHYGIKRGRNLTLVFDLEGATQEELFRKRFALAYDDDLFHSGKTRFHFQDLKTLPKINTIAERK